MKKLIRNICFIFAASLILGGCSKKQEPVMHDMEAAKVLEGAWQISRLSQAELHPDMENPDYVLGLLTYKSNTTQKFNPDQTFESIISQEAVDFVVKDEKSGVSMDDIKASVNENVVVYGTYKVSADRLELTNLEVSVNGDEKMPFTSYLEINPAMGAEVSVVDWAVKEGKLYLFMNANGQEMSVAYSKVE